MEKKNEPDAKDAACGTLRSELKRKQQAIDNRFIAKNESAAEHKEEPPNQEDIKFEEP